MSSDVNGRYATEIELLQSMYNELLRETNRELDYTSSQCRLSLRIPEKYLIDALPEVIVASIGHQDARNDMRRIISGYTAGEEILDAIILAFIDLASSKLEHQIENRSAQQSTASTSTTVIIWLHHLLNTNKRKQCLSPDDLVSGVTKPGYPGVIVYSGPSRAVHDQVDQLKQLNWAAFQVRLETKAVWQFKHGKGVIEVEAMKDIVTEIGEYNKEAFLASMRMK